MKRLFAILSASLILLSGLHLTVASHICCGELAAVKYSFTREKATCGMEDNSSSFPAHGVMNAKCCENRITTCMSDTNYFPASQEIKDTPSVTAPLFTSSAKICIPRASVSSTLHSMVGPPVFDSISSVDQTFICVFTI